MPVGTASVKSEYQRSFRPELFVCSTTAYRNNRAFRRNLKTRFQGHAHDPFVWDDEYDSSEDEVEVDDGGTQSDDEKGCRCLPLGDAGVDRRRPAFVRPHQFKHEMWNRRYARRLMQRVCDKASQTEINVSRNNVEEADRHSRSDDGDSDDESSVVHVLNGMSKLPTTSVLHILEEVCLSS